MKQDRSPTTNSSLGDPEAPTKPANAAEIGLLQIKLRGPIDEDGPICVNAVRAALLSSPGHDRILIDIETDGGDVDVASEIFEVLRSQPVAVAAITRKCHSAGMIVFLAAGLRIARPDATFLLHPISVGRDDLSSSMTIKALRDEARRLEVKHNRAMNFLADRTGFDLSWFCKEAESEEFMDVAVATSVGIIHSIEGKAGPGCDWPVVAKQMASSEQSNVYLPQYLTSANFFEACRLSAQFQGVLG